jgi:hypothetical protein
MQATRERRKAVDPALQRSEGIADFSPQPGLVFWGDLVEAVTRHADPQTGGRPRIGLQVGHGTLALTREPAVSEGSRAVPLESGAVFD